MANRFDELAKLLASGVSRRQALKVLGGSILGGLFAGKAVEEAGAAPSTQGICAATNTYVTGFVKTALVQGCKRHCAIVAPIGSAVYNICIANCYCCPKVDANNPGGPDNLCGDYVDTTVSPSKTYHRATCCPTGMPCNPSKSACLQCPSTQTVCTVGGNTVCCPRNSRCMNVSGQPVCVVRCNTVVCNGQCCRSGYHCGTVSGSSTLMCLPGASASSGTHHAKKHHKHA